ncbi:RHS repeat-associated core domain-containing protein [Micromonospora pallida]|uniref:RHS repeat-associated core domain-containing protein n=1 Tax=Micromonospora pallida TaxID=145854 RepID=A0A1C6T5M1_9ACTN|nr:RHS repeat-associated core domain-containing protein [Micromonospora pallida]SCL36862.1 RHS repeat-associated core domain-containing protein [Micromonospora pallida]
MRQKWRPELRRPSAVVAAAASAIVALSLLQVPAAPAAAAYSEPPLPKLGALVRGSAAPVKPRTVDPAWAAASAAPAAPVWPAAGTVDIPVAGPSAKKPTPIARAAGLAVAARVAGERAGASAALGRLRVRTYDRAVSSRAGITGPTLRLQQTDTAADGPVEVSLGYQEFAGSYGGDWASRLRAVALPECALTTPELPHCRRRTPLPSVNDSEKKTVTARIDATTDGTLLALEAGDASAQGDYAATKLSPSASWNVALNSGGMSWNYPVRVPPTPGQLGPQLNLNYSSQSVDGQTSATNNQGSWIGEGFSYEPGYIQRRYKPCTDDGHDTVGDQCWAHYNATMVLGGQSGDLIKIDVDNWKLADDSGAKIQRLAGANNGDDDGEYWKVTTTDGTEYFFGLNRLPGWTGATGQEETSSAWTVPIYGDDAGEPCNDTSGFASSYCDQAWRWNLDYVKDTKGNVISYYYGTETNYYARGAKTDVNGDNYHRAGWLKRIDYGQRESQVYSTPAPARVRFTVAERCLPASGIDCDEADLNQSTAASWPDVPFDRICAPSTHCKIEQSAPTFFTRKRLTGITTEIRSGTSWSPVDSWELTHEFKNNGDASRTLWLSKITQTGHRGGATLTLPSVELVGIQMPNRIDAPDDMISELNRYRLKTIYTDTGAQIDVTYGPAECTAGSRPKPGESTKRCYPVIWRPVDDDKTITDWFHKYVVEEIITTDRTGGGADMVTRYEYDGDAGWRKNKPDGITKNSDLTWGDWRGYEKVIVRTGDGQSMPTRVDNIFLRGMHGDPLPDGGTRNVTVTDSVGTTYTDLDEWSAHPLETLTYDGSTVVSKSISKPWLHHTHTQTESWGTRHASLVRTESIRSFTALKPDAAGTPRWRENRTVTTHDTSWGRATQVEDLGDVSRSSDDTCTRTWYADNPDKHLYTYVKRTEKLSVNCGVANPDRSKQVLTDTRTYYDQQGYGVAPTAGVVSRGEELAAHDGTTPTYSPVGEMTVDAYGRTLTEKDAAGNTASTAYVETNGLTTQMAVTNPLKHATTTTVEPSLGLPTTIVDPNGKRIDLSYDSLGRLVEVWLANRSRSLGQTPSIKYTYLVRTDKALVIKTEKLKNDGTYRAVYDILDSLTRPRQSQQEGPDGGWLISDLFYSGTGQVAKKNEPYHALGTPGDQPIVDPEGSTNGQTSYLYDGAGRTTAEIFSVAGDERWRTTTSYEGDRTHVDPPDGATPTTTVTDARGNTVEIHHYKGDSPSGPADVIRYTHTPGGELESMTDAANNVWRYSYNQLGQKVKDEDPDRGITEYAYDTLGRLEYVTDSRGEKLKYVYDALGRKTQTWRVPATGNVKLAEWSYDGLAKGQLHWAARYVSGQAYGVTYSNLDSFYRPGKTSYTIPSGAGTELAKTYDFTQVYNLDDTVQSTGLPAAANLPAEAVVTTYDALLRPTGLANGTSSYVTGTSYSRTGELMRLELSVGNGKKAVHNWTYERGTGRLLTSRLDRPHASTVDSDALYNYDEAGNILSISDTPAGGNRDIQCFTYDHLRRLTEAWSTDNTNTDSCAGGPATTGVGGPAPYHHSWEIDEVGNRKTETIHGVNGASDTTRSYKYPASGSARPHTLSSVEETDANGTRTYRYGYDQAGNTKCRPSAGAVNDCETGAGSQSLTWDAEGKLTTVTVDGKSTSFIYDADGNRLVRKEPDATTVYLPGMELRLDLANRSVTGTRFYSFAGRTVAVRGPGGVSFPASDQHGTAHSSVDAGTGAITWRRTTPYGGPRGAQPATWPDQRGFVGGTIDPTTGLTQLGARSYDQAIGRFISVDALIDPADAQQWNGYAYANNSPVTSSDPSGLIELEYSEGDNGAAGAGGSGSSGSSGNSNPYSSDEEERASTGDPERARELRKKRFKQIKEGRFDFSHLFDKVDIDIKCKGPLSRLACNFAEEVAEDKILDELIRRTLDRIDESRSLNGKEFGFSNDEFAIAFELAWGKDGNEGGKHVESRGDGRRGAGLDDMPVVGASDNKGFDAYVDGVRSEFKTVRTNTKSAVHNAMRNAKKQHAGDVYIRVEGVDAASVNGGLKEHNKRPGTVLKNISVFGTDSNGDRWRADLQPIPNDIDCAGIDWVSC